ncbi:MAG: response regulator [Melioribacteraceae bacterium]
MELTSKIKKILLVDDDIDLLEQNKLILESKGVEVVTAETGKEGLQKYLSEKPDAVIVDLIMEEHDSGFVLCYKLKKNDIGKNIPVIILTSATYDTGFKFSTATPEEKKWIKCDAILNKPIVIDELITQLNKYYE